RLRDEAVQPARARTARAQPARAARPRRARRASLGEDRRAATADGGRAELSPAPRRPRPAPLHSGHGTRRSLAAHLVWSQGAAGSDAAVRIGGVSAWMEGPRILG